MKNRTSYREAAELKGKKRNIAAELPGREGKDPSFAGRGSRDYIR